MTLEELQALFNQAMERLGVEVMEHHLTKRKLQQALDLADDWKGEANQKHADADKLREQLASAKLATATWKALVTDDPDPE